MFLVRNSLSRLGGRQDLYNPSITQSPMECAKCKTELKEGSLSQSKLNDEEIEHP